MIFPTQWTPKDKITLHDGLLVEAHKRSTYSFGNSHYNFDSVVVENYKDDNILENWVLFHSFIFDFNHLIRYYQLVGTGYVSSKENVEPLGYFIDYDHILPHVYFYGNEKYIGSADASYAELYKVFLEISLEGIDLLKNYFQDFSSFGVRTHFIDSTYWQIVVYYSIIEKIIGKQKFCSEKHVCSICNKSDINHYPISTNDWVKHRFQEIVSDTEIANEYIILYKTVGELIRHKTVHEALIPSAELPVSIIGEIQVYDVRRSLQEFSSDKHALASLEWSLKELSRYMLLNRLFDLKIFPALKPMKTFTIAGGV